MKRIAIFMIIFCLIVTSLIVGAGKESQKKEAADPWQADTFSGLKLRSIGPAFTSGRIADFAVNPLDPSEYYVAVAAGNVWKTTNSGITWTPIFDKYGSWSIADVELDPNNPHVVWVGTGEYNSQRAIGYGDGVYRSEDGGKSFKNMGLKKTEHIGRIIIDPRNSHVYVAAQGPLWGPGGERGLYKSTDQGKTWKQILTVSENTGFTDIVMDPRNPDVLYAAAYQRRRHVFTLINGGPESALYRSTDAGTTWEKLTSGLPGGDVGRIGLAISPVNPDVIYAIIEAEGDTGGFFRSTNRGATWEKRNPYVSQSPQYYNRIFADPKDVDVVYSMDTVSKVTVDGGKSFSALGLANRHVDDHALWIDPKDTRHLLIGGDGGIYESFDRGKFWLFKSNLPVTQFYRVSLDNRLPFYYVYGGTQDNNSMGGPSQTISADGIVHADWTVTNGGDGFKSQIDPENPDIVYAQSQYGGLVRFDKKSGESLGIQPMEGKGEAFRWNWNAPLIISPHSPTRLYFAANILFRSDNRGDTWTRVSGDLSRQLDRDKLPVMGKIQSPDAVAKNSSTSLFGNIVALDESPLKEGLLLVGTDDGLIQISENGGASWRRIESVPGVPAQTYVSCLYASLYDKDTIYAAFDGRKNNDLKPYLFKSTDLGKTWTAMITGLPETGTVYSIIQDHVKKDLLFIGTEFGLYFTINGGQKWVQLKGDLPTTAVFDLAIQKRETDLAIATFGRGFYILDNYAPLRELTPELLAKESFLFGVKDALLFIQSGARYGQGETYFKAKNPAFGATITYYLKESVKTLKEKRKSAEAEALKKGLPITYPTFAELRAEDEETAPYLLFTITDEKGEVVRQLSKPMGKGVQRLTWDLRYPDTNPISLAPKRDAEDDDEGVSAGMPVLPGKYTVTMSKYVNGVFTPLEGTQTFVVRPLNNTVLPVADRQELTGFQARVSELSRVVRGAAEATDELLKTLAYIKKALENTPQATVALKKDAEGLEAKLREIKRALRGDSSISKRSGAQPPALTGRLIQVIYSLWDSTSAPTQTMKDQYELVSSEIVPLLEGLRKLKEVEFKALEAALEKIRAPWTPGRIPEWGK